MKQIVEIKNQLFIPFEWRDLTPGGSNLGRCEFIVCPKFKRREICEFWVDPVQSRMGVIWHFCEGDINFTISAYEGLTSEGAWMFFWCKEHKTTAFRVYAPAEAKFLEINRRGLSFWRSEVYKPTA
ncbi:MAG: hypothetical protein E6Q97_25440 [Desulfurellales bacterium]|nr:MAG: hypothetical protein E6Q97_25440 [Desulfurellales bacterium]